MSIEMSESIGKITLALSKASMEFKPIYKSVKGYNYKYAPLENCYEATKSALSNHELAVIQTISTVFGDIGKTPYEVLVTTLAHSSGEYFRSTALISPNTSNKMVNPLQNWGIALTYLRRYSYCAILGVTSEDEDSDGIDHRKEYPVNPSKGGYVNNMVNPPKGMDADVVEGVKLISTLNILVNKIKEANIDVKSFASFHDIKSDDLDAMQHAIVNFEELVRKFNLENDKEILPSYVKDIQTKD